MINQVLHKKSAAKLPAHFIDKGKTFTDPYDIACKMNDFFCSTLARKIENPGGSPLDHISGCFPLINTFHHPDVQEIINIVNQLKPTKPGHDKVKVRTGERGQI